MSKDRPLRIFISYASQDVTAVRKLYERLKDEPWIEPWFDKEDLLPGQDWSLEIDKGLRAADVIIVCLSKESVAKEGYVQREFKRAADFAEEKPEDTIFLIPLRLDDCNTPVKFGKWQWVDYFSDGAYERLLKSLIARAQSLDISIVQVEFREKGGKTEIHGEALSMELESRAPAEIRSMLKENLLPPTQTPDDLDLHRFIEIKSRAVSHPFWIGKYPVTNAQYERFLNASDYSNSDFWVGFPKFDKDCKHVGNWGEEGLRWLEEELKDYEYFPLEMWRVQPRFWEDPEFGIAKPNNPVVGITWYEANAYCKWLALHWDALIEHRANSNLSKPVLRLVLEAEWVAAAGGKKPEGRYPWDLPGRITLQEKEIICRANLPESGIGHTTPVMLYANGKSPFGVMDMAGNVREWQANCSGNEVTDAKGIAICGTSWSGSPTLARESSNIVVLPYSRYNFLGFRVVISPILSSAYESVKRAVVKKRPQPYLD